jgi:hypothetical protein
VVLLDKTRCDCVTDTHAIEFDFGSGWAESIGQGLHYSALSKKKAGIVLILEIMKDRKYWIRLTTTIQHSILIYQLTSGVSEMQHFSEMIF